MIRSALLSLRSTSRLVLDRIQGCHCRSYATSSTKRTQQKSNGHENELCSRLRHSDSSDSFPVTPASVLNFVIPALVGFGGLATFLHYNDERRAIPKGQVPSNGGASVAGPKYGGKFTLVNTNNEIVDQSSLLGKWVLLYFGYTSSPDVGPGEVQKMVKAVDLLESKANVKVQPVFVTIDPQRDSPSQLKAYLREFDSRIVGLTGPVSAVKTMAQDYRVPFKKIEEYGNDYLVDTSHNMHLISPSMDIVKLFGTNYNEEHLSEEILEEIRRTSG